MFGKRSNVVEKVDSWQLGDARSGYLIGYRENLNRIASELHAQGLPELKNEYYPQKQFAQLVTRGTRPTVAARIRVTGHVCLASNADVTLVNLPASAEDIFRYHLWPLRVSFTHVSYLNENGA